MRTKKIRRMIIDMNNAGSTLFCFVWIIFEDWRLVVVFLSVHERRRRRRR